MADTFAKVDGDHFSQISSLTIVHCLSDLKNKRERLVSDRDSYVANYNATIASIDYLIQQAQSVGVQ